MKALNKVASFITLGLLIAICSLLLFPSSENVAWTNKELAVLKGLRLPPQGGIRDPSNAYLLNPHAVTLGKLLFFDTALSRSQQIACATCHQPAHAFTLPQNSEITLDKQVPSLLGTAHFNWFMLDGSADSLWAQALKPLEHPLEHNGTRADYARYVLLHYPQHYRAAFGAPPLSLTSGDIPHHASPNSSRQAEQQRWQQLAPQTQTAINRVFANIGKSLAAYQATLWPRPARFDRYIDQLLSAYDASSMPESSIPPELSIFTADEIAGLKLFISEQGKCLRCHNGPLLSNGGFHVTTVPTPHPAARQGRLAGIEDAHADPFNCTGDYSDSPPSLCKELRFSKRGADELKGATKVPSLRNIANTAPYMHAGQFSTLKDVLHYYNRAAAPRGTHNDLVPLKLLPYQLNQLEAFLLTLTGEEAHQPEK